MRAAIFGMLALLLAVACSEDPAGSLPADAGNGDVPTTDGTDSTDGTDGTDSTDGTDGTEGSDSSEGTDATDSAPVTLSGYHIGNSLTADSAPGWQAEALNQNGFEVTNGWHMQCGQPLVGIQTDPWTCVDPVEEFGEWPAAMSGDHEWDYVTVQPFPGGGSSLSTDVAAIGAFLENLSSPPDVYLYAAWPPDRDTFLEVWETNAPVTGDDPATVLRPAYFDALWGALEPVYGDRLHLVPVGEVMFRIAKLAEDGELDWLDSYEGLFRDTIHASTIGQIIAALTHATVIGGKSLNVDAQAIFEADQAMVDRILQEIWAVVTADLRTGVE